MLVIRLFRTGKINQPSYNVVVTDKTKPTKAGRFLEIVGTYNPLSKNKNFKKDRIKYWISVGAQPSDTVHNLLVSEKIIEGKKISSHNKAPQEADKSVPTEQVVKPDEPVQQTASTGNASALEAPAVPVSPTPAPVAEEPAAVVETPAEPTPAVEAPADLSAEVPLSGTKEEPVPAPAPAEESKVENPADTPAENK